MLLLYWATRLWGLLVLPTFLDEGIYLRRGLLFSRGDWLVEITDGTVLHPRVLAAFLPFLTQSVDTLTFFGRWFSVAFDALALTCLFTITRKVFSERAAICAAGFYLLFPFVFFYDRMALADGPLMTWYALAFWLSLRVADGGEQWRSAALLGVVIGAAILTKLSGILYVAVPLLAIFGARDRALAIRQRQRWTLSYAIAGAMVVPLFVLGAGQYQLQAKTADASNASDFLAHVVTNAGTLGEWAAGYAPGLLLGLVVLALVLALGLRRTGVMWVAAVVWPLVFFVVISRVWYPRYVLMAAIPLAVVVGGLCAQMWDRVGQWQGRRGLAALGLTAIIVYFNAIQFDYWIMADPPAAPWPAIERWQYIADWPAGYGIPEAAQRLNELAAQSTNGINVVRMNKGSPVLEILDLYAWQNPRIALYTANFAGDNPRPRLTSLAQQKPTYIIVDPPREGIVFIANYPRAQKVAEFSKPGGESAILIYQWP